MTAAAIDAKKLSAEEKALKVNLNPEAYGSFAEIGAGQEVARWFFRAGKASATIAKTISAYDMSYSDYLYGAEENHRYVCESRVRKMLDREYSVLTERTSGKRPEQTRYFAFADTVASKKATDGGGHGWMGIKFQHAPLAPASTIVLHVRLRDDDVLSQQEAVGVLGVNLVHGAVELWENPHQVVMGLKDGLKKHKLEVDMIDFSGPAFTKIDNRVMSVYLVELGFTNAVIFTAEGKTLQPSDALYKKNVLVQRGRFRPLTNLHVEMFVAGKKQFLKDPGVSSNSLVSFFEITLNELKTDGTLDVEDFLARVDMIKEAGQNVMISNYGEYFRLSEFFSQHTQSKVGMIMGVGHLKLIFDEKFYTTVSGGMMAALGHLFSKNVVALVFPAHSLDLHNPALGKGSAVLTTQNFPIDSHVGDLYNYMRSRNSLIDIEDINLENLQINSEAVLAQITEGAKGWEKAVPLAVAKLIKQRGFFRRTKKTAA
jgi:hypothetical protein